MARPTFRDSWKADLLSGFLVFMIALPLSLGIALASGFPPIAGVMTAVIGGLVATFFGSAPLTIKGPAAGLIVIAIGAVTDLGQGDMAAGYKKAIACVFIAGCLQIIFALLRAGTLGDFFPSAVVHGMLSAIGVTIFAKQIHVLLGVTPKPGNSIELLGQIPTSLVNCNPEVMIIGAVSLAVMFGMPKIPWKLVRKIPAPLVVVAIAITMGAMFELGQEHHYQTMGHDFLVGPKFLVKLPASLLSAVQFPDFSAILSGTSIKYIIMFALVGSIESLLTAKAIDSMDPFKRRANLDKDLLATGVGVALSGLIGGLPMISEVVRSSANVNNGARTKYANFFHGAFLLLFVAIVPMLLQKIPLAALAAMLCFTGYRLASPSEFKRTWQIGREQMIVFMTTLIVTLCTDLLVGVFAGVICKALLHLRAGLPLRATFKPRIDISDFNSTLTVKVAQAAVFSNFLSIKRQLDGLPRNRHVVVDFSTTRLVDHTVMERLHGLAREWKDQGGSLDVIGLENHRSSSSHPLAARRRAAAAQV